MSRLTQRIAPLTPEQKREFLDHLQNRIRLMQEAVTLMPRGYYHFTVAAVHGRALAQFLGLSLRKGHLALDKSYFAHDEGGSYEVKAQDLIGEPPINISAMSPEDKNALEIGFDTINREFAHLTYWPAPGRQHKTAATKQCYHANLGARLNRFCAVVLREINAFLQKV